ncbi:MAG: sulfatase family protein [Armatimonadota bacterium]
MARDILVLMTDQHRADWVGCYGATWVRTPTLDSLAAEGVRFARCITTSPLCMPARASFLTGQYPHNTGMWDNIGRVHDVYSTYLHPLREAGYHTCHIGKSHLHPHGGGRDLREELPYMHALGWNDVLECTGPLSTQTTFSILTDWMQEEGIYQTFLEDYRRRAEHPGPALWPSPLPDGKHPDDFMARTAVEYIKNSDRSKPLFLFLGLGGPHNPWDPPKRFDTYKLEDMPPPLPADPPPEWLTGPALEHHTRMMRYNKDISAEQWARMRSLYSGRVEHVDYCMGQVLEAWYKYRGRDTWVIFWSDHGDMLGDKRRTAKSVFYKGSVQVPAILRPPNGCVATVCEGLVSTVDLTATLLDIAGCEPQQNVFGKSLLPVLTNPESVGSEFVVSEVHDETMISDGNWRMVVNAKNDVLELYNIANDPNETINLAGRPDTEEQVQRLRSALLGFLLKTADRQTREING